jgi:hypothetical protein
MSITVPAESVKLTQMGDDGLKPEPVRVIDEAGEPEV